MRCLIAVVAAACSLRLCHAGLHVEAHGDATADSSEASMEHSIVLSSMQDYLNQIGMLEISNPNIAIPGQWLTDAKKSFIFLPVKIPKVISLNNVKLLTDGRQVLVNVIERPVEVVEDEATKKFRLILDSFKEEAKGDETVLSQKLNEWEADEDNIKVKQLIAKTLSTLHRADVHEGAIPKALTIPLNTLELGAVRQQIAASHLRATAHVAKKVEKQAEKQVEKFQNGVRISNVHGGTATIKLRSTYLQQDSKTTTSGSGDGDDSFGTDTPNLITIPLDAQFLQLLEGADYVVPLTDKDAFAEESDPHDDKPYIKESFSISLPYPTPSSRIFAVLQSSGQVVICMPYEKGNKAKSSPFVRIPVFDMNGKKLVGQGATSADLAPETSEKHEDSSAASKKAPPSSAPERKLIPVGL